MRYSLKMPKDQPNRIHNRAQNIFGKHRLPTYYTRSFAEFIKENSRNVIILSTFHLIGKERQNRLKCIRQKVKLYRDTLRVPKKKPKNKMRWKIQIERKTELFHMHMPK